LPARSQPPSCINKRLLCPSLASTLRNPILPKAVSKRKYVGLNEPNFDEDEAKKRPNAGKEYDPDADYIYDARKYFNPEKYRELIAHQEQKKKKQEFAQKNNTAFRNHRKHRYSRHNVNSGHLSVDYFDVQRDGLPSSSLWKSEFPDVDELQDDDSCPHGRTKKVKRKSKHSRHRSHSVKSSHKHVKRKKDDDKKRKRKRKRKKSSDGRSKSLGNNTSNHKHHKKQRHRSKLFLSQGPSLSVLNAANCDTSYEMCNLNHNSAVRDHISSNLSCSSDDVVDSLNCRPSLYEYNYADCNSAESGSEDGLSHFIRRPVNAVDTADMWEEDSSVSSEYSDFNETFSDTDDEHNCDT